MPNIRIKFTKLVFLFLFDGLLVCFVNWDRLLVKFSYVLLSYFHRSLLLDLSIKNYNFLGKYNGFITQLLLLTITHLYSGSYKHFLFFFLFNRTNVVKVLKRLRLPLLYKFWVLHFFEPIIKMLEKNIIKAKLLQEFWTFCSNR